MKPRVFWVDPGGDGIPMSVIDQPPEIWKDKVTGYYVAPEYRNRFIKVVEMIPEIDHALRIHEPVMSQNGRSPDDIRKECHEAIYGVPV